MRSTTRSKFESEVRAGRLWRAKEILRGNLPNAGYDIELYEEYGKLLLTLGDELEAGKYLFLCGVRRSDYEHAIELFLSRHRRGAPRQLFASFPAAARLKTLDDYPPVVAATLVSLGVQPGDVIGEEESGTLSPLAGRLAGWGCGLVFAAFVAITILGFIEGLKLLLSWRN